MSRVLSEFLGEIEDCQWRVLGQGNINDTFLARSEKGSFIVQRINGAVFPNPESVADNTALVSAHIFKKHNTTRELVFPEVFTTLGGKNFYRDNQGSIWRVQKYIRNSISYEAVKNPRQALEIGRCLGRFHRMVQDLPPASLTETLPGFHDLPEYLQKFNNAWSACKAQSSDYLQYCLKCVNENNSLVSFFADAVQCGDLQDTVTHGDPKVANILFDKKDDKALTLIDLDTVGPGLILHDLGDCLRSCCSRTGENDYAAATTCDSTFVAQVVAGYVRENELNSFEQEHVYTSLYLITLELGVRFLTDYLEGNRYFKVENRDDNLHRALVQFRLVRNIKAQQKKLRSAIAAALRSNT
jgi:Ser/Thr protein kinase RdoA (MazF antagonist)